MSATKLAAATYYATTGDSPNCEAHFCDMCAENLPLDSEDPAATDTAFTCPGSKQILGKCKCLHYRVKSGDVWIRNYFCSPKCAAQSKKKIWFGNLVWAEPKIKTVTKW